MSISICFTFDDKLRPRYESHTDYHKSSMHAKKRTVVSYRILSYLIVSYPSNLYAVSKLCEIYFFGIKCLEQLFGL